MAIDSTVEAILKLLEAQGLTVADLEAAGQQAPSVTVAGYFDEALATMTESARSRYQGYLEIVRDGLPGVCWCQCEQCSGYLRAECPCHEACNCPPLGDIPVLEVTAESPPSRGVDRHKGCGARLVGLGAVSLTAVRTGHLAVVQAWVKRQGKKRWVAANAKRAEEGRAQHTRDGRSAEENFVSAVRCFFKAAVSDGYLHTSPAADLNKPKRRRPENRALTEVQLNQLWDAIWETGSDDPELDTLLIWTQLETGARRAGILTLTVDRVSVDTQTLKLCEKYDEWREQPVSHQLVNALLSHARSRGGTVDGEDLPPGSPVFYYKRRYDKDGHLGLARPLTRRRFDTLYSRLRRHLPWADEAFTRPHDLRKTAGSFVERIAGTAVARHFLGHAYTDPTDLYVAASDAEVAAAFAVMTGLDHHPRMGE